MTRRCSEYDGLNAKKAIKGAFGDGVMASHQLGALLWPTTALYYAKCYLCKSTKANNALRRNLAEAADVGEFESDAEGDS